MDFHGLVEIFLEFLQTFFNIPFVPLFTFRISEGHGNFHIVSSLSCNKIPFADFLGVNRKVLPYMRVP
jgi:hypothetical protein